MVTRRAALPRADELFGPARARDGDVVLLRVDRLVPAPDNPRRDPGDLSELAASIRAVGLLEPLIVAEEASAGDGYVVVAGHRRLAAARLAGLVAVPAIVRRLNEAERAEIMLIENLQREGLSPLEEASAYRRLRELGQSQRQLAARVGRSQAHISKRLALLELPEAARRALDSGGITLEDAQALQKLRHLPDRLETALGQGRRYGSIARAVEAELEEHRRETARAEAEDALRAIGATIVPWPPEGFYGRKEAALAQPGCWPFGGRQVGLTVDAHAGEPCHAATVYPRDATTIWLCTNPDRHRPKGSSDLKGEDPSVAAKREESKARRAAERARSEFMRGILAGKPPTKEATEHALAAFVAGVNHAPARIACKLLGLSPVMRKTSWGSAEKSYRASLTNWIDEKPSRLLTVALAVAFAEAEEHLRSEWHGWGTPVDVRHFAFLAERGYVPGGFEMRRLEEGRSPAPTDEELPDEEFEEEPDDAED